MFLRMTCKDSMKETDALSKILPRRKLQAILCFSSVTLPGPTMTAMTMTNLIEPRKFEIQYKKDRYFKNENVWIISEAKLKTKKSLAYFCHFSDFFSLEISG